MTWRDTIDDWDAVLSEETDDDTRNAEPTATDSDSIRSDGGSTIACIDPMSDPLLDATLDVLPEHWRGDRQAQRLVQWVVYAFVEETAPSRPAAARASTAIAYAADRTDTSAAQLKQLCTTGLYRDRRGSPQAHLTSDLETIAERSRSTATAPSR